MRDFTSDSTPECFQLDSITSFDDLRDMPQLYASEETLNVIRLFAHTYGKDVCQ